MIYKKFTFDFIDFKNLTCLTNFICDDTSPVYLYINLLENKSLEYIVIDEKTYNFESYDLNSKNIMFSDYSDEQYELFLPCYDVLIEECNLINNSIDERLLEEYFTHFFEEKFKDKNVLYFKNIEYERNTLVRLLINNLTSFSYRDTLIDNIENKNYALQDIFNLITKEIHKDEEDILILKLFVSTFEMKFKCCNILLFNNKTYKNTDLKSYLYNDLKSKLSSEIISPIKKDILDKKIDIFRDIYPNIKKQKTLSIDELQKNKEKRPSLISRLHEKNKIIASKDN